MIGTGSTFLRSVKWILGSKHCVWDGLVRSILNACLLVLFVSFWVYFLYDALLPERIVL